MRGDFDSSKFAIQVVSPDTYTLDGHINAETVDVDAENVRDGVMVVNVGSLAQDLEIAIATCYDTGFAVADTVWLEGSATEYETIDSGDEDQVHTYALEDLRKYVRFRFHTTNGADEVGVVLVGWNRVTVPVS